MNFCIAIFWDIFPKFDRLKYGGPTRNAVENEFDWTALTIISLYLEKIALWKNFIKLNCCLYPIGQFFKFDLLEPFPWKVSLCMMKRIKFYYCMIKVVNWRKIECIELGNKHRPIFGIAPNGLMFWSPCHTPREESLYKHSLIFNIV